ncbi:hypothetical protein C7S15_8086 [Burkholderia cepacia]|nr:hypothetical protein [Burkholderia cepacia]
MGIDTGGIQRPCRVDEALSHSARGGMLRAGLHSAPPSHYFLIQRS